MTPRALLHLTAGAPTFGLFAIAAAVTTPGQITPTEFRTLLLVTGSGWCALAAGWCCPPSQPAAREDQTTLLTVRSLHTVTRRRAGKVRFLIRHRG